VFSSAVACSSLSFVAPAGGVVCAFPRLVGSSFARAASAARLARSLGLPSLLVSSPLSCGGGGVLLVVGPSRRSLRWAGVAALLASGAAVSSVGSVAVRCGC